MAVRYLMKAFLTLLTSGILLFSFSVASVGVCGKATAQTTEAGSSLTSAQGQSSEEIATKKRKAAKKKTKKNRKATKKKTKKKRTAKKRR